MKKLAATVFAVAALVATLAPAAQAAKPDRPAGVHAPCICDPLPEEV